MIGGSIAESAISASFGLADGSSNAHGSFSRSLLSDRSLDQDLRLRHGPVEPARMTGRGWVQKLHRASRTEARGDRGPVHQIRRSFEYPYALDRGAKVEGGRAVGQ